MYVCVCIYIYLWLLYVARKLDLRTWGSGKGIHSKLHAIVIPMAASRKRTQLSRSRTCEFVWFPHRRLSVLGTTSGSFMQSCVTCTSAKLRFEKAFSNGRESRGAEQSKTTLADDSDLEILTLMPQKFYVCHPATRRAPAMISCSVRSPPECLHGAPSHAKS